MVLTTLMEIKSSQFNMKSKLIFLPIKLIIILFSKKNQQDTNKN